MMTMWTESWINFVAANTKFIGKWLRCLWLSVMCKAYDQHFSVETVKHEIFAA